MLCAFALLCGAVEAQPKPVNPPEGEIERRPPRRKPAPEPEKKTDTEQFTEFLNPPKADDRNKERDSEFYYFEVRTPYRFERFDREELKRDFERAPFGPNAGTDHFLYLEEQREEEEESELSGNFDPASFYINVQPMSFGGGPSSGGPAPVGPPFSLPFSSLTAPNGSLLGGTSSTLSQQTLDELSMSPRERTNRKISARIRQRIEDRMRGNIDFNFSGVNLDDPDSFQHMNDFEREELDRIVLREMGRGLQWYAANYLEAGQDDLGDIFERRWDQYLDFFRMEYSTRSAPAADLERKLDPTSQLEDRPSQRQDYRQSTLGGLIDVPAPASTEENNFLESVWDTMADLFPGEVDFKAKFSIRAARFKTVWTPIDTFPLNVQAEHRRKYSGDGESRVGAFIDLMDIRDRHYRDSGDYYSRLSRQRVHTSAVLYAEHIFDDDETVIGLYVRHVW